MTKQKKYMRKFYILLSLIILSCFAMGMSKNENNKGKIFKNINIENINVENMTFEQAQKEIFKKYTPKTMTIVYQDNLWKIDPEDIDLNYNIESSVQKAYDYTREGKIVNNIIKKINLWFNGEYNISLYATYNEYKLNEIINTICEEININAKEAEISIGVHYNIEIKESKEGLEVDTIKLKEIIYDMINKKEIKNTNLPVKVINPKVSTKDVKSVDSIIGQYSTSFNQHTSRGSNIHKAGESTSDILLMPGEVFSYNKSTGARTWANGYKSAKVIVGGKYVNGEGGGVCQVSTTIYNAALLAGMEINEVHNHTFASRYAPKGQDAAVSYGYTDFKFTNLYSHPIYIKNIVKNGVITSKIYGCRFDKQRIYIKTEQKYSKDKIDVDTYRVYLNQNNQQIRKEHISKSIYKIK